MVIGCDARGHVVVAHVTLVMIFYVESIGVPVFMVAHWHGYLNLLSWVRHLCSLAWVPQFIVMGETGMLFGMVTSI